MFYKFPDKFFWGSATSAHQVEGGNFNDWSEWEKENAERLAAEAAKRHANPATKIPDYILAPPAGGPSPLQAENYISGRACDHYNRYEEDFDILKQLGQNAHRFSIEWSRIEPEEGRFDEKEIEHYRRVLSALRSRGIEPFVTLWHWTNPIWIRDIGGWENKKTVEYFLRYAKHLFDEYGRLVKFWIPLNEPGTQVSLGHIFGTQPPGDRNKFRANKVFKNLMVAQKQVFLLNKKNNYGFKIGSSHFMFYLASFNNLPWNWIAKKAMDYVLDSRFLKVFKHYSDFFGIQYYEPFFVNLRFGGRVAGLIENKKSSEFINDLGWEMYYEGIYHVVKKAAKYKKPIYITENGLPDARDKYRGEFIKGNLKWLHKAISEGADVRGYFHWSLLDNFEMPDMRGFWCRFGLVEIDYKTMGRKIRPSAWKYAKICRENKIEF